MARKVLVVGNGGREHALCWKLAQSPQVDQIFCAPGNGGTAQEQKTQNVPIAVSDFNALIDFARNEAIDLTVIGPDNPLADGIVDVFEQAGLKVFGPQKAAARLEASKVFSKEFMRAYGLPTAQFEIFDQLDAALTFCKTHPWARVIKVDGLALGKGVYVCDSIEECQAALIEIFEQKRFGQSGAKVIVEERLQGFEVSLMVLCDGKTLLPMTSSQDFKRRFEGNQGPNTGGMGAYSPVPQYEAYQTRVETEVLEPLAKALEDADFTYKGLLYVGLMFQADKPYILEFNARFGDPETQCLLPRLENDLYDLFSASIEGTLSECFLRWSSKACVGVVLCADTYPTNGLKDVPITVEPLSHEVMLFHAGTRWDMEKGLLANGGRILNVVTLGENINIAVQNAYEACKRITFPGMAYRKDIAKDVALCLLK